MKMRFLSLLLAFALLCGLLPVSSITARADSGMDFAYPAEGGNIYFDKESGTITGSDETVTKADIPAEIDGVAVTSIGDYAFYECYNLTSVTIPSSVTSIGDWAFDNCDSLTAIQVAEGNTAYASEDGVLFDKQKTVLYCYPAGKTETEYGIPDSVTSIGDWAFSLCISLTSVTIPDSVTSIGDGVFSYCYSLTSVTIPSSVTSIGDWAFYECESLTSVTIPDSVTTIGDDAFCECTSLTSVTIPGSVTSIGNEAFLWCTSLTSVTIPSSVTSIGDMAFSDCRSLTSVCFMGDAPELGDRAFQMWDVESGEYMNIPGLTLYYIEGKEGWTTPTWNGYPTATWNPEEHSSSDFTDVPQNEWYAGAVKYAVENNLFLGTSDTTFSPNASMTRAMLVTVLWRLDGKPETSGTNPFSDVSGSQYYAAPVLWASSNGIVYGTSATKFSPDGSITREQMAAILFRYAQQKGYDTSKRTELSKFPDNGKVSDYAKEALSWANAEGLVNGDAQANGTVLLDPAGKATRAQVAAILMRFVQNIADR